MDRRLLFCLLPGCFQPYQDLPVLDFSEVSYDVPGLETSPSENASASSSRTGRVT